MANSIKLGKSPKALSSMAEKFEALGDETQLGLIMAVTSSGNSEACICDLTPDTGLAQRTVSQHLKLLVEAGLLTPIQRDKWASYGLTKEAAKLLS